MSEAQALELELFREEFDATVKALDLKWEAVGFYAPDGRVYPFGTDTKVISTVFEALAAPLIADIAVHYDYAVESSEQTVYPDFTLSPKGRSSGRIAIDIKTTYRRFNARGVPTPFRYTLGSYTSFLRDSRKNIKYAYPQYSGHWVLGFLYTRRKGVAAKVYYRPEDVSALLCPYMAVAFFILHKYKIAGESPASGNTANIGSFPTATIRDLRDGRGPFADLGKDVCDEYWRNYQKSAAARADSYSTLATFRTWRMRQSG